MRSDDRPDSTELNEGQGGPDTPSAQRMSIGAYLVQQRKLRGVSLEELADLTRIPLRSLERLESGHFDHDIDGFVRGFVRTVADALGLDPDDTVARMLVEPTAVERTAYSGGLPLRAIFASVAALVVIAGVLLLGRALLGRDSSHVAAGDPVEEVIRVDAVRALAEAAESAESAAPPSVGGQTLSAPDPDDSLPAVGTAPPVPAD